MRECNACVSVFSTSKWHFKYLAVSFCDKAEKWVLTRKQHTADYITAKNKCIGCSKRKNTIFEDMFKKYFIPLPVFWQAVTRI